MVLVGNLDLLGLYEGGEELDSDLGNGLLVGHRNSLVESLRARDAVFLAVHHEATKAGVVLVFRIPFGEEVGLVDLHLAGNVRSALKCLHL